MSYLEYYNLINTPYVGFEQIKKIAKCGTDKARDYINEIKDECALKKIDLPHANIPTQMLLKKLGIDFNTIYELAKKQKEMERR